MGWKPYAVAVAAAAALFATTLLAYRLIDLTVVSGVPMGRATGFLLSGLADDVGLAVAFGSLAGGVAVGRRGLGGQALLLPALGAAAVVLVMSGLVDPIVERAVAIGMLGGDPALAFPMGLRTPWSLVKMAMATSAGELPVLNPSITPGAMANVLLLEASLPFSLAALSVINSGAGLLVGSFKGELSQTRCCWFVSLLTSASYLAGSRLALVVAVSEVVRATTIVSLPLVVPASVIFTLVLTTSRSAAD